MANILEAAKFPTQNIVIEVANGRRNVIRFAKNNNTENPSEITAVLVDSDTRHIPDALAEIQHYFENYEVSCFFVVPEIEAWLFADDVLIQEIFAVIISPMRTAQ